MALNSGTILSIAEDITYGEKTYKDDGTKNKKQKREKGLEDRGWVKNGNKHQRGSVSVEVQDDTILIY